MVEWNKINVKLSNSQLNKLKSAVKNRTRVALRVSIKISDGYEFETTFRTKFWSSKNLIPYFQSKCCWGNKETSVLPIEVFSS